MLGNLQLSCTHIPSIAYRSHHDLFPKTKNLSINKKQPHLLQVSCNNNAKSETKNTPNNQEITSKPQSKNIDRRDLLLGMSGGLYGASNLILPDSQQAAIASPISSPDLTKCTLGTNLNTKQPLTENCCPPVSTPKDYKLPQFKTLKTRPAAHLVDPDYIAKYEKATELMKALPKDDPRSFMQQANVHCAYCNLTYDQRTDSGGSSDIKLQIHNCWLFFPWHRWYLYFYERILAKLIGDDSFALPFWNWDDPQGMVMPSMFARKESPLYDPIRDLNHLPPSTVDLTYSGKDKTRPASKIVSNNLSEMYGEMVRNAKKLEDFYGAKYVTGTATDPGPGSVERGSHMVLHSWVGSRTPSGEDMGNFYSVGRDPIFYCHHTNVDRMWYLYQDLRRQNSKPTDITDPDYLNADFVFYDENGELARVRVKDSLDHRKMGYTYQEVPISWLTRPKAKFLKSKVAAKVVKALKPESIFPVKLDKIVKVLVDRPKKSRSKKDKEDEEELLIIEGIEVDTAKFVKFDVFVNDEDDDPDEFNKAEYAGCYTQVQHKNSTRVKTKIRLGLTELLEDLDAEDDDQILVTLVPKANGEDTTIGGVKIVYAKD